MLSGICLWSQISSKIDFDRIVHDFGKIKHNIPVSTEFNFINNTGKPLIIKSAVAECGCTDPSYDKKPIPTGKSSTIKVTYKADTPGAFNKKVTITFINTKEPIILTISGEVME